MRDQLWWTYRTDYAPNKDGQDIIIGCSNINNYDTKPSDFRAPTRRYANLIDNGVITIDDATHDLPINNFRHCFYPDGRIKPVVPTHQGVKRLK